MNPFRHSLATDTSTSLANHRNRNRRAIQFFLFAVAADALLILFEFTAGISPLEDIVRHPLIYGYVFLVTVTAFSFFGVMIGNREDQLEAFALRDSLTGLFNARYLWARIDEQWAVGKREKKVSSLILLDLDFFKRVNDTHGHPVGDELLKRVGKILQGVARKGDTVARIGGEEFVFFLPNTSVTDAAVIAERIRASIGQIRLKSNKNRQVETTISAGVTGTSDYDTITPQALYSLADKALYCAKERGRNKVITSNSSCHQAA